MKRVFVSGCYDILHAGHIQFFKDARALGDFLTVCFASNEVLKLYKKRESALPEDNKQFILESIRYVDRAVKSSDLDPVFDFASYVAQNKPDILAVTEDDRNTKEKMQFCREHGIELVVLPKRNFTTQVSTTDIRKKLGGTS